EPRPEPGEARAERGTRGDWSRAERRKSGTRRAGARILVRARPARRHRGEHHMAYDRRRAIVSRQTSTARAHCTARSQGSVLDGDGSVSVEVSPTTLGRGGFGQWVSALG